MSNKRIESLKDLRVEKARLRAELRYREMLYKIRYDRVASVVEKPERILTMAISSQNNTIRKTANVISGIVKIVNIASRIISKIKARKESSEQESI